MSDNQPTHHLFVPLREPKLGKPIETSAMFLLGSGYVDAEHRLIFELDYLPTRYPLVIEQIRKSDDDVQPAPQPWWRRLPFLR